MRSKASIAGHPLHPTLVALPIGPYVWAFICSIVYLATADHLWYAMSLWTSVIAIITALLAAIPGFVDYFTMAQHSAARRIATTHMVLNLLTLVLFFIAAMMMRQDRAVGSYGGPFVLQLIGIVSLLITGWLGGEMVYRHHLAVVERDVRAETPEDIEYQQRLDRERRRSS